jgi:transposase
VKAAQRRGYRAAARLKLIDQGVDQQKVATLFKVGRKTLYRALATP